MSFSPNPKDSQDSNDHIDELKSQLYSKNFQPTSYRRKVLHDQKINTPSDWQNENQGDLHEDTAETYTPIFKKVLLFALVFFLVAAGIAIAVFVRGTNVVSPNNIDITMQGSVSTPAGEAFPVDIQITNNNPTDLLLSDLVVTYPESTRLASDQVTPLITERIPVGTLPTGKSSHVSIDPVLFGQENSQQNIKVSLEYRIPGSASIFVKNKDYPVFIGTAPISITVDSVKETVSNQDVQFDVHVKSNSTSIVKNVLLKAEYPFGFSFESSNPDPASPDNTAWNIGDISPGTDRHIIVVGRMTGQDGEERDFHFSLGLADQDNPTAINAIIANLTQPLAIKQPFLGVDILLNDDNSSVFTAQGGDAVRGEVSWQNNLNVPVTDASIKIKLAGKILDTKNILVEQGFFSSSDNTMTWDKTTVPELASIAPHAGGKLQFTLASLQSSVENNAYFRKPSINLDASVSGRRLGDRNVVEDINSTVSKTIRIATAPHITSRAVHTVGPFINTGPIPPVVDQNTTYTIIWTASNSFNTVNGATVSASLPNYVGWLGKVSPAGADVKYDQQKHQVIWNVGTLAAGAGYSSAAPEAYFQVSFLPSVSQLESSPEILGAPTLSGTDSYTSSVVQNVGQALDSTFATDPAYNYGDGRVTK